MTNYKPRPENKREFLDKLITPYDKTVGNPNVVESKEIKPGQPEFNRAYEISQKNDTDINVSIGIKEIDEAVLFYFTNIIKPNVIKNNIRYIVPVIYGSPEKWKSVQVDGYYKDVAGKVQVPLIMFKRENIERNRDLGNKLDGNKVNNLILAERKYSRKNIYDNFNLLTNRVPEKQYVVTFPPDYVTITYSCIIYTDYVEQMDKLIEAINFTSDSYWGDPKSYQFRARIDSYTTQTSLEVDNERVVKSTFNIILNGYIIPDSINKEIASIHRLFSPSQIVFGLEVADTVEQFTANQNKAPRKSLGTVVAVDNTNLNISTEYNLSDITTDIVTYLNTNISKIGTVINSNTVTIVGSILTAPPTLPVTDINKFEVFCNGQYVEKTAITGFTESSGTITLTVNTSELGFTLEVTDEILIIGKFVA